VASSSAASTLQGTSSSEHTPRHQQAHSKAPAAVSTLQGTLDSNWIIELYPSWLCLQSNFCSGLRCLFTSTLQDARGKRDDLSGLEVVSQRYHSAHLALQEAQEVEDLPSHHPSKMKIKQEVGNAVSQLKEVRKLGITLSTVVAQGLGPGAGIYPAACACTLFCVHPSMCSLLRAREYAKGRNPDWSMCGQFARGWSGRRLKKGCSSM